MRVKKIRVVKFSPFVQFVEIFFNSWRLHNGWAPAITWYWESQLVAEWTFTSGGVDVHTRLFIVHRCLNLSIHVLNFNGWSHATTKLFLTTKIFPIYGNLIYIQIQTSFFHGRVYSRVGKNPWNCPWEIFPLSNTLCTHLQSSPVVCMKTPISLHLE